MRNKRVKVAFSFQYMQKSIAQTHSIIKGERKEEVFGRVQVSSGVDEP